MPLSLVLSCYLKKLAQKYGINDAKAWAAQKADILAKDAAEKAAAEQASVAESAFYAIPANQQAFIDAVVKNREAYNKAENDMMKGSVRRYRSKAVSNPSVNNWVGTIDELTTNSDGKGVVSIIVAEDVKLQTSNNSFSDIMYKTLLDPESSVFQTLAKMKKGDKIKFSGQFLRDSEKTDCYAETSLTMDGSMTEPEYVFRFSDVSTYQPN